MPGSIASRRQGPVAKGKRMAGHMGDDQVTVKNLEIVSVDAVNNVLAVKGAVPGARGTLILIKTREGKKLWQK
jgi:large subunit ribosomal protein L3